jgi:hypothetical protein
MGNPEVLVVWQLTGLLAAANSIAVGSLEGCDWLTERSEHLCTHSPMPSAVMSPDISNCRLCCFSISLLLLVTSVSSTFISVDPSYELAGLLGPEG